MAARFTVNTICIGTADASTSTAPSRPFTLSIQIRVFISKLSTVTLKYIINFNFSRYVYMYIWSAYLNEVDKGNTKQRCNWILAIQTQFENSTVLQLIFQGQMYSFLSGVRGFVFYLYWTNILKLTNRLLGLPDSWCYGLAKLKRHAGAEILVHLARILQNFQLLLPQLNLLLHLVAKEPSQNNRKQQ